MDPSFHVLSRFFVLFFVHTYLRSLQKRKKHPPDSCTFWIALVYDSYVKKWMEKRHVCKKIPLFPVTKFLTSLATGVIIIPPQTRHYIFGGNPEKKNIHRFASSLIPPKAWVPFNDPCTKVEQNPSKVMPFLNAARRVFRTLS